MIQAARDALSGDFGAEQVILSLRDGVYYGLEDVGARLWALIQQPAALTDVLRTLGDEYDVEPAQLERDVRALLDELVARGLVEVRAA